MAVRGVADGMGDDALVKATGKSPEEWFALLDAVNATTWTHPTIVTWLTDEHDVPAWWRQSITIRYEQEHGMRQPGQRADGTFEVNKSRIVPLEQHAALDAIIAVLEPELGAVTSESRTAKYLRARWKFEGTEALLASAEPEKNGRTPIVLSYSGMETGEQLDSVKQRLGAWLDRVL